MKPKHRAIILGTLGVGASGCGGIPDPPDPLSLRLPPLEGPPAAVAPVELDHTAAALGLPRAPALPLPEPRIDWWPPRPRPASIVAIRLRAPAGPTPEAVRLGLGGREVRAFRSGRDWIGLASLPLDSAGAFALEYEFARGAGRESRSLVLYVPRREYPSTRIRLAARPSSEPDADQRIERERAMVREVLASSDPVWHPTRAFGWPRQPPIKTSPFGQQRVFNGSVQSRHTGLDLRARLGNPIRAPAAGRVALAGSFFYQGNAVYLDHGLGLVTAYYHMSSIAVDVGDMVRAGDLIGRGGSTGRSTAAHLHWAAWVDGRVIDPETLPGLALDPVSPGAAVARPR